MKALTQEFKNLAHSLWAKIDSISTDMIGAGQILIEMKKLRDDAIEILLSERGHHWLPILEGLERVGEGSLDARLLMDPSPAAARAVKECLDIQSQKILLDNPIPVVVRHNGGVKVEQRRMPEIKAHELSRVIRYGKIQTVEQQTEIVKEQIERKNARHSGRYLIDGETVRFLVTDSFTWNELEQILNQIKPKAEDIESSIKRNQVAK